MGTDRQAHTSIDRIDRESHRKPSIDQSRQIGVARIEINSDAALIRLRVGRMHRESERARRLQRVSDVQIMRPSLGKVLPRMCTGIGRYETVAPVGRRAESVVLLQWLYAGSP